MILIVKAKEHKLQEGNTSPLAMMVALKEDKDKQVLILSSLIG